MITDIATFLRYFDAVHRRTVRDVAALPVTAESWRPPEREGEAGWDIGQIVRHIAGSRRYFAGAYRGEGWRLSGAGDAATRDAWVALLERTAEEFRQRLADTPHDWLRRRVRMIDTDGELSGWRILLMMVEHEVHHRSQIDTYAGLEGWPVPHIYGRSAEQIQERAGGA